MTAAGADLRTMRRAAMLTLYCGALLGSTIGVFITERTQTAKLGMAAGSLAFLILALLLSIAAPGRRVIEAGALLATLVLGAILALAHPIGLLPMYYLWPVIFAAYFSSLRMLGVAYGVMLVSLGAGLALNQTSDLKVNLFIACSANVGLVATLIAFMTRRERRLRADLEVAAHTDPLTGLLNRRAFNPQLEELIASGAPVSVALFDIDHFKTFNDRHGHVAGDDALCCLADVLRAQSTDGELVARFGGEEFAVALPGADAAAARAYAERIGEVLIWRTTDRGRRLSVSAGIATLGGDLQTFDALISHADDALYAAKAAGRARAAWWDGTIQIGDPAVTALAA